MFSLVSTPEVGVDTETDVILVDGDGASAESRLVNRLRPNVGVIAQEERLGCVVSWNVGQCAWGRRRGGDRSSA